LGWYLFHKKKTTKWWRLDVKNRENIHVEEDGHVGLLVSVGLNSSFVPLVFITAFQVDRIFILKVIAQISVIPRNPPKKTQHINSMKVYSSIRKWHPKWILINWEKKNSKLNCRISNIRFSLARSFEYSDQSDRSLTWRSTPSIARDVEVTWFLEMSTSWCVYMNYLIYTFFF
jgi:hypothetical protein